MRYGLIIILFLVSSYSYACRCVNSNINDAYSNSDIIIIGKVLATAQLADYDGNISIINVIESWKGFASETIAIKSITNCSLTFNNDLNYMLFLKRDAHGTYYTDKCLGSKLVENLDESINLLNNLK